MPMESCFRSDLTNFDGICILTGLSCKPLKDCTKCLVPCWPEETIIKLKKERGL